MGQLPTQRTLHRHRAHEPHNEGAGHGAVLLDIGAGVGALVLYTDAALLGAEIEISPVGQDGRRSHVAVLGRPGLRQHLCAAVYPTLTAGMWTLWDPITDEPVLTVRINEGEVTEAWWPIG